MNDYIHLPGPGDQCLCGSYHACRCLPEPEFDWHWQDSYQAGHDACRADGYDERPGSEWIYATDYRAWWSTADRRLVYAMTTWRFSELTWRHSFASAWAYARWFECQYGYDLDGYLDGYDDAGCGLPSAAADPERHRICAAALDALEPEPMLYDEPIGPMPALTEAEDGLPF